MGKVYLLDCTLRDGGYVNDWMFGETAIKGISRKLSKTGIEMYEIGFIKGDCYNSDRAVYPDIESIESIIAPKASNMLYVGMVDMSSPVPFERIIPKREGSIDGIRVIFKKDKLEEGYEYCKAVKEAGYKLFVQFVGTDNYTDEEITNAIKRFNSIEPYAMSIVDSFGLIKRKDFLRMVRIFDEYLLPGIALGYHAHNNLQLAYGNAEELVEMNIHRDIIIDGSIFGMGRGAGNLNMELFADYMNENHGTHYSIEPMLEIMDDYLTDIYKKKFWGYSLPLYLSAKNGCHPNYAIYFAEKDSLTEKSLNEIFKGMDKSDKVNFSKEKAEKYYKDYQEKYIDDRKTIDDLTKLFVNKKVLLLAPGKSLLDNSEKIVRLLEKDDVVTIALNFMGEGFGPDYIFSSNMRRYGRIEENLNKLKGIKTIITSNMSEAAYFDYMVNFASYSSDDSEIIDNSGIMAMKLLVDVGVQVIYVAGMDGYSSDNNTDYFDSGLDYDFSKEACIRNKLIAKELQRISKRLRLEFVTDSLYKCEY